MSLSRKILEFKAWSKEETEDTLVGAGLATQGQLRKLKAGESFIDSNGQRWWKYRINGRFVPPYGGRGNSASKNGFITPIQCRRKKFNLNLPMLYSVAQTHSLAPMMPYLENFSNKTERPPEVICLWVSQLVKESLQ